jgi:hypothetical protein
MEGRVYIRSGLGVLIWCGRNEQGEFAASGDMPHELTLWPSVYQVI